LQEEMKISDLKICKELKLNDNKDRQDKEKLIINMKDSKDFTN
jgi:hypothetical protein